jgi:hypothetical protein
MTVMAVRETFFYSFAGDEEKLTPLQIGFYFCRFLLKPLYLLFEFNFDKSLLVLGHVLSLDVFLDGCHFVIPELALCASPELLAALGHAGAHRRTKLKQEVMNSLFDGRYNFITCSMMNLISVFSLFLSKTKIDI